jgi:trimethylamine--corrinoid protein Co-methyltransferase
MTGFERTGNYLQTLTYEEIERIHQTSLEVLERTGMIIRDGEIVQLLEETGCEVDLDRGLVKISRGLVEEAIEKAPSIVTLCGRSGEHDLHLGDGKVYARTAGGATRILDLEAGAARSATKEDVAAGARLADALPNIHGVSMNQVVPMDVPVGLIDVHAADVSFCNTGKHLFYICHNEDLIEHVIEMAAIVIGGDEALRERPIVNGLCEATAPLRLVESQARVLKSFAANSLPLRLHSHPVAGFTSPVTLAGELVITNAEILGLVVISQLINPHTPVIYGMSSSIPDMRTSLNLAGAVEIGLLGAAIAQLARHYSLPCSMTSAIDAEFPGPQAVLERLMTSLLPILAGVDLINLNTIQTKLTFSLEQLVIDDEIMRWIAHYLRGIRIDDETLAVDLINEVGPGGAFFDKGHTARHLRDELLLEGLIREPWKNGEKDLRSKARRRAKEILIQHRSKPLGEEIIMKFAEIVGEARRRTLGEEMR